MEKLTTTTYKVVIFIFILALLIYIHDVFPKNYGKIGRSSVRVYLYTVLAEIRFLGALFFIYYLGKGKSWRFVVWLPIIMTTYQAIIRLFTLQKTNFNEFDVKLTITVLISIFLTVFYFWKKRRCDG